MKAGILFSGGKDSTYAAYLAKQAGYELTCLITVFSENQDSYMFHTPSIKKTQQQARAMDLPIVIQETKGIKEEELKDLYTVIKSVKEKFGIDTIVTGAVASDYQASRIQKICDSLDLKCLNPIWGKEQIPYLKELVDNKFKIIIIGVAGFPLDESWLGREINDKFIEETAQLQEKYQLHPAGEGGEFETFVLDCPLFQNPLEVVDKDISGEKHSWRMEIEVRLEEKKN